MSGRAAALRDRLVPRRPGWLLASGVLLGLAHPPFHLLLPSFVALVPFVLWILDLPEGAEGGREARRGGFFLGLVYYGLVLYWLFVALVWYSWQAILGFLAPVLILSAFLALMTFGVHQTRRRLGWPIWIGFPVLWTANEWLRAHIPDVAFPWMQLGDTLTGFPWLIGAADLAGSRGLSFWLALANALVAVLAVRAGVRGARGTSRAAGGSESPADAGTGGPSRRLLAPALGLLLTLGLPAGYSLGRWSSLEMRPAATVGVIQPNVPEDIKLQRAPAADSALRAAESLIGERLDEWRGTVDLVVLPETAIPLPIEDAPSAGITGWKHFGLWAARLARVVRADLLFGAMGLEDLGEGTHDYFNSAFLLSERGERLGRYDKRRLVPIVERVPFVNPRWFAGLTYFGGFGVGEPAEPFRTDGSSFGVLICYESIYSGLARRYRRQGADFLVNITNDAWFGRHEPWWSRTSALWQHPAHLVMRSVETRMGAARSANTGISFLVDPLGRKREVTELFTTAAFQGRVMTTEGETIYVRFGDLVGWGCAVATLAAAGLLTLARRREDS